jgi:hypothetical protein
LRLGLLRCAGSLTVAVRRWGGQLTQGNQVHFLLEI